MLPPDFEVIFLTSHEHVIQGLKENVQLPTEPNIQAQEMLAYFNIPSVTSLMM